MPRRIQSAPMPLGPSSLVGREARRGPRRASPTSMGSWAAACTASTWMSAARRGPDARRRARRSAAWCPPRCWPAGGSRGWSARSAPPSARRGRRGRSGRRAGRRTSKPNFSRSRQDSRTALCSTADRDDAVARRLARPGGALDGQVDGLRAAAREDDAAGLRADAAGEPLVGLVEGRAGAPPGRVRRRGVGALARRGCGSICRRAPPGAAAWRQRGPGRRSRGRL